LVYSSVTLTHGAQQYCIADGKYTTRIPEGVTDEEAGPIMCGGVTAYTACKRSAVKPGQWIILPGAGGGLGHFAVQYAKAMGMRVIAIDGGDEKRDSAPRPISTLLRARTLCGGGDGADNVRCARRDCHGGHAAGGTRVRRASCGREARWSRWACRRTLLS
jgi:threonine dehydrogenase-like Zn-dependent dehydrogenase